MKEYGIRKFIGINDFVLIAVLAALPILMLTMNIVSARNHDSPQIAVYVHGELYGRYDPDLPAVIDIGGTNTLTITDGKARMTYANCPDQICVHSLPLGKDSPGSIVCLPNGIVVLVENADDPLDIDGYVS